MLCPLFQRRKPPREVPGGMGLDFQNVVPCPARSCCPCPAIIDPTYNMCFDVAAIISLPDDNHGVFTPKHELLRCGILRRFQSEMRRS